MSASARPPRLANTSDFEGDSTPFLTAMETSVKFNFIWRPNVGPNVDSELDGESEGWGWTQ